MPQESFKSPKDMRQMDYSRPTPLASEPLTTGGRSQGLRLVSTWAVSGKACAPRGRIRWLRRRGWSVRSERPQDEEY